MLDLCCRIKLHNTYQQGWIYNFSAYINELYTRLEELTTEMNIFVLKFNDMNFKEYFKELSIVILGLLIAFWISNIGSYYKERATQKQVLLTIMNELKGNNENVKSAMQSLDTLRATFTRLQNMKHSSVALDVVYNGLSINSIGYETAKYTGILKDINYALVSKIVGNYESQNSLKELEKVMSDELFLFLKHKVAEKENLDYLLLQISNLTNNLEEFDTEQKQLIEKLMVFLEVES